jgi:hypothetical protein
VLCTITNWVYLRIYFSVEDLVVYFDSLNSDDVKLKLETLKGIASTLVKRYASQDAYELALSKEKSVNASTGMKVPAGSHFTPPSTSIPEEPQPVTEEAATEKEKPVMEEPGFTGDRPLANADLFKLDFGLWIEAQWAVAEGDIGRVLEILKVGIP